MTNQIETAQKLDKRGVLYLSGKDTRKFLNNLITQNPNKISKGTGIYASLLTPQGKYLFDFFLIEDDEHLLLDCHESQTTDLLQKLTMYKLRADVEIRNISGDLTVWALSTPDGPDHKNHITIPDPRHPDMGYRLYLPRGKKPIFGETDISKYETKRIELGIPEGPIDLEVGKRFIMEANLEELNGLDFNKGCYVGQEINARMKHRGTLKKRIIPVEFEGSAPSPNTKIMLGNKEAGYTLSHQGNMGLALMRLERLGGNLNLEDGTPIKLRIPNWLKIEN